MDKLIIPDRLYGRDRDIANLLESFERSSRGHGEVMLVHGPSGAGKTALVQALKMPVRERNGFFIKGKFDQYQQNIPYYAFRQALAELCREFLSGNPQQRSHFKSDILKAIGNHGQLLVDLVPEFELLLGTQPSMGEISPQEARHRFADVIRNFLKAVCRPEHPLVLFIDDWQWADAASIELLKQMQVGATTRYILTIISYRDNEADSNHPLHATLDDLKMQAVPVADFEVKNITISDIREIVTDTLHLTAQEVAALSRLIHDTTMGNPFFVRSLLLFLHELDFICFDNERNCWQWRMDKDEEARLPNDVVELFAIRLHGFDAEARNLFSLAACLGNHFDLETLCVISGMDYDTCLSLLFSSKTKGIFQALDVGDPSTVPPQICAFQHDRLQQAAYMLIEPAGRPNILLKIGRLLLSSLKPDQLTERLFEVVNNLNAGVDLIEDTQERVQLVELNMAAARKAYAATAYSSALQFYRAAARYLETPESEEHLWNSNHELSMALFKESAECEFLAGDRDKAEKCIQQAAAHSSDVLEKADAFRILIIQCTLLARYPEAIVAGRLALDSLQITLPEDDYESARDTEIALVRKKLKNRTVASLFDLPVMSDPRMLMAAKVLITMGPPCYRAHQRLWSVIVPKVVNLTLKYGNIPQTGYSHTAFGGLLGWVDDDYVTAREFGELANRLMTGTFTNPTDQSVFYLMNGSSLRHWSKHLQYGTQDYRDAYEIGLRSGNLQYAAYAFGHNMYCQFYQGVPLAQLLQESLRSLEFSRSRLNQWAIDLLEGGVHLVSQLTGETAQPNGTESRSEAEYLKMVEGHHNIQVICIYRIIKTFSLLVAGNYTDALTLSDATEPLLYTVGTQGLLPWPEHRFARFLIISALFKEADEERQATWRAELDRMMGRLRIWADNCPENFEHKYLLAAAELARIDGRPHEAMRHYDEAVEAAHAGNFPQWEGITSERAYHFYHESGNERLAQVYWQQAYFSYDRWGAVAKVRSMEAAYRKYLAGCFSGESKNASDFPPPLGPRGSFQGEGRGGDGEEIDKRVERRINRLRTVTMQMQQAGQQSEAVTLSRDLADAMQRLRMEIADHKRTEEALRKSENQFKKLFIDAPLGIALIDSLTGHIYEVNPMFAKIAGRTVEEMEDIEWMQITHPDDIQEDLDNMALLNAGSIDRFQMEKRYLHPDGEAVWINMTIAKMTVEDKEHPRHLCMIEDITRRKVAEEEAFALEQQFQQTQKLESLGVLAGGIAHDFNNILAIIMGYCGLTKMDYDDAVKHIPEIEKAAERAAALCRQMLAYAGKASFTRTQFSMPMLVDEMISMLRTTIKQNVVIKSDLSVTIPVITGDVSQIRQVVMNLIINAAEAIGDDQGEVAVSLEKTEIKAEPPEQDHLGVIIPAGRYICFEVTDNGCGMDYETRRKLFEPFYTTKFSGRGLGMSAVLGIIKAHDGALQLTSQPGQGSIFKVYLPVELTETGLEEASRKGASATWQGCGTVLLVEDETQIKLIAATLLKKLGFKVIDAANGLEALELYRQHTADIILVVTDLGMPVMNGYELFHKLKQLDPQLPIIVSSGFGEGDIASRIPLDGIAGMINKPYNPDLFQEVLRGAVVGTEPTHA